MSLLILIRHGKAAEGEVDIERPLTDRGRRDGAAVGRFLAAEGVRIGQAAVSSALRARQTWDAVQADYVGSVDLVIDDRIYDNEVTELLEVIQETADDVEVLALVGHNPSFEQLAHALDDGTGDSQARQTLNSGFPTSGVAIFECAPSWSGVRPQTAILRRFTAGRG